MPENVFYTSIAEYYEQIFPLKPEPIRFVRLCLPDQTGATEILDIGCSTGQMAYALVKIGYRVTGIDLDEEMIRIAKSKSSGSQNPDFQAGNMMYLRKLIKNRLYDGILCFGNTIPHLQDDREIFLFFQEVFFSLKTGGKFMFQIVNYSKSIRNREHTFPIIDNTSVRFEREYVFSPDSKHIQFKTNLYIKSNCQTITNAVPLYPLDYKTAERLLDEAGFKQIQMYGNFEKLPYREDSPALIVTAKKD